MVRNSKEFYNCSSVHFHHGYIALHADSRDFKLSTFPSLFYINTEQYTKSQFARQHCTKKQIRSQERLNDYKRSRSITDFFQHRMSRVKTVTETSVTPPQECERMNNNNNVELTKTKESIDTPESWEELYDGLKEPLRSHFLPGKEVIIEAKDAVRPVLHKDEVFYNMKLRKPSLFRHFTFSNVETPEEKSFNEEPNKHDQQTSKIDMLSDENWTSYFIRKHNEYMQTLKIEDHNAMVAFQEAITCASSRAMKFCIPTCPVKLAEEAVTHIESQIPQSIRDAVNKKENIKRAHTLQRIARNKVNFSDTPSTIHTSRLLRPVQSQESLKADKDYKSAKCQKLSHEKRLLWIQRNRPLPEQNKDQIY